MDDDSSGPRRDAIKHTYRSRAPRWGVLALAAFAVFAAVYAHAVAPVSAVATTNPTLFDFYSPGLIATILTMIMLSGFFSASEVAFFSIHRVRLRGMAEEGNITGRLVADLLNHPNRLLTTILVGNMIVNVLISVLLPARTQVALEEGFGLATAPAYVLTVLLCTGFLVFFGEITPKIFAVRVSELFARVAAIPLKLIDSILGPLCWLLLRFTDFVFRLTRFNDIKAAPFITDEEFISLLTHEEAKGVIEEEEGQMIQGILEFGDAMLREIVVPRPDVIALSGDISVREALEVFREHEFSRMPVYSTDLDHITGTLFAKDLLPHAMNAEFDLQIAEMVRPAFYVPETMSIQNFVKEAQRVRKHLAIVVDEYGGTEGIVTLEDALEEVVGEIEDDADEHLPSFEKLNEQRYRVDGNLPLDELSDLIGVDLEDDEHETVSGFLMARASKVLEQGDHVNHLGVDFKVEAMDGKRAESLTIELLDTSQEEAS